MEQDNQEEDTSEESRIIGTGFGGQNAPLAKEIPEDFVKHFRLGGWFYRLPRAAEGERGSAPNRGSSRPVDIHTAVWCRASQVPQSRELHCRTLEANGEEPPEVPDDVYRNLPENVRLQIAEALVRRDGIRAARNTAAKQRAEHAKAAADKNNAEAQRRKTANNETNQSVINWDLNPDAPAFFPEANSNDQHFSEDYGAAVIGPPQKKEKHKSKFAWYHLL